MAVTPETRVEALEALKTHPLFTAWLPGELGWQMVSKVEATRMGVTGWGLFRGSDLLEGGTTLPTAEALAARVETHVPSKLSALGRFLKKHPDHVEARRLELSLIMQSPHPAHRIQAIKAARELRVPFLPPGPITSATVWSDAARAEMPLLQASLRAWPTREAWWLTLVDWSALVPMDLAAFREGIHPPQRGGWASSAGLGIAAAVAERLVAQARLKEAAHWCERFYLAHTQEAIDYPEDDVQGLVRYRLTFFATWKKALEATPEVLKAWEGRWKARGWVR